MTDRVWHATVTKRPLSLATDQKFFDFIEYGSRRDSDESSECATLHHHQVPHLAGEEFNDEFQRSPSQRLRSRPSLQSPRANHDRSSSATATFVNAACDLRDD